MNRALITSAVPIAILVILFLVSAYFADAYGHVLLGLTEGHAITGLILYSLLSAVATVIAPLSTLPLLPLASATWGAPATALASIVGWSIGSFIAFYLSRRFGRPFVEKLFSKESIEALERKIPEKRLFWSVVFLHMVFPGDILSYVLGLYKPITWRIYIPATLIGITPFAFIFAYVGTLPFVYQLLAFPIVLLLIFIWIKKA